MNFDVVSMLVCETPKIDPSLTRKSYQNPSRINLRLAFRFVLRPDLRLDLGLDLRLDSRLDLRFDSRLDLRKGFGEFGGNLPF